MENLFPMGIVTFQSKNGQVCKYPKEEQALLYHSETPREWCRETHFIEPKGVFLNGTTFPLDETWGMILKNFPKHDFYKVVYTKHL
jgi:hypothetical protein